MSDEKQEGEEKKKGSGDCMTPTVTMMALLIAIVVMVTRWLA